MQFKSQMVNDFVFLSAPKEHDSVASASATIVESDASKSSIACGQKSKEFRTTRYL